MINTNAMRTGPRNVCIGVRVTAKIADIQDICKWKLSEELCIEVFVLIIGTGKASIQNARDSRMQGARGPGPSLPY